MIRYKVGKSMKNQGGLRGFIARTLVALIFASVFPGAGFAAGVIGPESVPASTSRSEGEVLNMTGTIDGRQFVTEVDSAARGLSEYSVKFEVQAYKGKETLSERGNFYFKAPGMMRVEETGSYKHGAVVVVGADGKARGHLGGLFSSISVDLNPGSNMLRSVNDWPLVDSDFASLTHVLLGFVHDRKETRISDQPVAVEDDESQKVYVLEISEGPGSSELFRRLYIDPHTMLPLKLFCYSNGRLQSTTSWTNLQQEIALDDNIFRL